MSRIRSECPDLESSESSFDKSPTRKRTKRKTRTRATATAKKKMTVMGRHKRRRLLGVSLWVKDEA